MATLLTLPAGFTILTYAGTSSLPLTGSGKPSWFTTDNFYGISKESTNRLGFATITPGPGFPTFTTLDPVGAGQPLSGYIFNLKKSIQVDASLFSVPAAPAIPQLATPTGTQASPLGSSPTTGLSVAASSVANATGYQLYTSATQAGTYAKLGGVLPTPSYTHNTLSAAQTQWYEWQALGDGVTYADSKLSAPFSGTTASQGTSQLSHDLTGADMQYNAYPNSGTGVRSSLSEAHFANVTGPSGGISGTITALAPVYAASPECAHITIWNGANLLADLPCTSNGTNTLSFALPAGVSYSKLRFADGGQQRINDEGTPLDCRISNITFTAGTTASKLAPQRAPFAVYVTADSLANNVGATSTAYGWVMQLRQTEPYDIIVDCSGYNSWSKAFPTQADVTALGDRVMAQAAGRSAFYWLTMRGTNDFGLTNPDGTGYGSPATAAANAKRAFQEVLGRSGGSAVNIRQITPLVRGNANVPNTFGNVLADYTAAFLGISSELPAVQTTNGSTAVMLSDLGPDQLHLPNGGYSKLATFVRTVLLGQQVAFGGNTYARVANTGGRQPSAFTVTAKVVLPDITQLGIVLCEAGFDANGAVNGLFGFFYNSTTLKISGSLYPPGQNQLTAEGPTSFANNVPQLIAFRYDGTNINMFTGNAKSADTSASGVVLGSSPNLIQISGAINQQTGFPNHAGFKGSISNVSYSERALSDAEIFTIFDRDGRMTTAEYSDPSCLLYSPLLRQSGQTTIDNYAVPANTIQVFN